MASIIEAEHNTKITHASQSKLRYVVRRNHSFTVLPDAQTVIGVNPKNLRYLQAENLVTNKVNPEFANIKDLRITLIAHNTHQQMLLAAQADGKIMAFKTDSTDLSVTRSALKLGPTGVSGEYHSELPGHNVYACDQFGSLTALAGNGVIFIDTATNELVDGKLVNTAVSRITSMRLCAAPGKVVMTVTGLDFDYSESKTDVFDVTVLVKRYGAHDSTHMLSALPKSDEQEQDLAAQIKNLERTLQRQTDSYAKQIRAKDQLIRDLTDRNRAYKHTLRRTLAKQNVILATLAESSVIKTLLAEPDTQSSFDALASDVHANSPDTQNGTLQTNSHTQPLQNPSRPNHESVTAARHDADVERLTRQLRTAWTKNKSMQHRVQDLKAENIRLQGKVEMLKEVIREQPLRPARCEQW